MKLVSNNAYYITQAIILGLLEIKHGDYQSFCKNQDNQHLRYIYCMYLSFPGIKCYNAIGTKPCVNKRSSSGSAPTNPLKLFIIINLCDSLGRNMFVSRYLNLMYSTECPNWQWSIVKCLPFVLAEDAVAWFSGADSPLEPVDVEAVVCISSALVGAAAAAVAGSEVLDVLVTDLACLVREEELLGRASSAANTASTRLCTLGKSSPERHKCTSLI